MDKRTVLGFILIMAILMLWPVLTKLIFGPPPPVETPQDSPSVADSPMVIPDSVEQPETYPGSIAELDSVEMASTMGEPQRIVNIETKTLRITLSSRGGTVTQVTLMNYDRYDGDLVSLIGEYTGPDWAMHGALTLGYSDMIPAFNDYNFKVDGYDLVLTESEPSGSVKFTYISPEGASVVKEYTFQYDDYLFDLKVDITSPRNLGMGQGVTVGWFSPMEPSEKDLNQDKGKLGGFFSMGEEFDYFKKLKDGKLKRVATGPIDWVANRTKYFTAVIMANSQPGQEVIVVGNQTRRPDAENEITDWNQFGVGITYNQPSDRMSLGLTIYTGPLDYDRLKGLNNNLEKLVELGWKIFRPFAVAILWVFTNLHKGIPNYGFVIVVFSVLMKLVFWPLSHKSAKSMHKMREIQPKIAELKAKFKDEPGKLQQETMKIYKEYGVNPFGSCLPMLVQMPIFWAMYNVLSNSIELRGAEFIFWIKDLSQPDPTGEIFYIGVLPIIMGVSMFIQQKLTITDPKQKMMIYMMPVLFTFLFSGWASGLVLYWTIFNIMGIFEQWFVKQRLASENPT